MTNARRHPRITAVQDVRARFGSGSDSRGVDRVLNLSESGMLVADKSLEVGQTTGFELSGPSFHYAGVAEVVHLTSETTGLRFLSWQDHDNRPIRSLIEQRSDWQVPVEPAARRNDPVIRRVAVITGRRRESRPQTPPSPPEAGPAEQRP
jgi:PilZ domain-containing protein